MGHPRLVKPAADRGRPDWLKAVKPLLPVPDDTWRPEVVVMSGPGDERRLKDLAGGRPIWQIVDNYDEQLAELYLSQNAQLYRANPDIQSSSIADYLKEHYGGAAPWRKGSWVYYPWSGQLVHALAEDLFWQLRTIRNRDLITADEQDRYARFRVGCLGMSVGSSGAVALVLQGGSRQIKIADGAAISGSNLNRIRTGLAGVGLEKSLVIARQLYEMNPYITVYRQSGPVAAGNLARFIDDPEPLELLVDEIDDLEMKIRLRVEARRRRIPVIMATDLADDVMLDVERFDLDPHRLLFHGLAGQIEQVLEKQKMSQREWLKYATMIVGTKNVPLRMQQSLMQVGTKLPTQPQTGGTAAVAGSVIAYAARQLALGGPLKSGRMTVSLDRDLLAGHRGLRQRLRHRRQTRILDRAMRSM